MDYSGVTNPKRVIQRREEDAGMGGDSITQGGGDMSQSQFGGGRKRSPMEEAIRQRKLAERIRARDGLHKQAGASGY